MKVVLVNPNFQGRVRRIAQTTVGPPLGLAYLAAAARADGHELRIVDANALALDTAETAAAALEGRPDVVGLTATTPTVPLAGDLAARVKAAAPWTAVVVGGPHVTALPARTLAEVPAFDVVARGEAERTFPRLLAALDGGDGTVAGAAAALAGVRGLAFRDGVGGVTDTGIAEPTRDLDTLLPPARDLLPMERYRSVDADRFSTLLGMRGCPCTCVYCAVPEVAGRRMRYRSPAAVVAELAEVHARWGIDFFSFLDDTFTTRRRWVLEFADALEGAGLARRIRWICLTRADMVDRELLRRMRAVGCRRVEFGIESGSETGRAYLRKGLSEEAVVRAFRDAREVGLSTMGFVILNIPGETEEDIARTFALARRADPDYLQVSFLTPYPGTVLRDEAEAAGWITTDDWSHYSFLNDVVLRHGALGPADLQRIYLHHVRRFYLRPRTVWKLGRLVLDGTTRLRPLARTVFAGLAGAVLGQRGGRA